MTEIYIKFTEEIRVGLYITLCGFINSEIDIVQGNLCIDGKSLLGIYTLLTGSYIKVILYSEDAEEIKKFKRNLECYT